ncbi:hypothetical protein HY463_00440 [Candidatus Peregrinibacteria bacterium]|nr:hypothetical protein [Candidatus Peregrinibacteria bacterium]
MNNKDDEYKIPDHEIYMGGHYPCDGFGYADYTGKPEPEAKPPLPDTSFRGRLAAWIRRNLKLDPL